MRLIQPTLPQWYRGFDPIEVPWEEAPGSTGLPDIMALVNQNAERAKGLQNPDGSWDWPWLPPDEEEEPPPDDEQGLPPLVIPGQDEQEGPPPDDGGGEGTVPEDPTGPYIPPEGIPGAGSGGYTDPTYTANPGYIPPAPPSIGFDPDWDAVWGGVGAVPDVIKSGSIPQLMPGDLPGGNVGGFDVGKFGGWLSTLENLKALANVGDNPRGAFTGAIGLVNPAAGALAAGLIAVSDILNNKGAGARQDERDYYNQIGQSYVSQILPQFWSEALGRDASWVLDPWSGTGQSDFDFLQGWRGWLSSSGVGGREETPFQNFGKMDPFAAAQAIGSSLKDYYDSVGANAPGYGKGPGDFAPRAFLKQNYGWDPLAPAPNTGGWGAHAGDLSGLEYLFNNIAPLMHNTQSALVRQDPRWVEWSNSFLQERPNVALPQASRTLEELEQNERFWQAIEYNRMGGG
jgi:hypothetical protein